MTAMRVPSPPPEGRTALGSPEPDVHEGLAASGAHPGRERLSPRPVVLRKIGDETVGPPPRCLILRRFAEGVRMSTIRLDRRAFGRLAGASVLGAWAGEAAAAEGHVAAPPASGRALLKVGTQHDPSDATLAVLAALGVNDICSALPSATLDERWSVEGLSRLRERVEKFGIRLDMVPLPLSSHTIAQAEKPNIMLGKSPERDREIDEICQ